MARRLCAWEEGAISSPFCFVDAFLWWDWFRVCCCSSEPDMLMTTLNVIGFSVAQIDCIDSSDYHYYYHSVHEFWYFEYDILVSV